MRKRKTKTRGSGALLAFLLCCLSAVTMVSIYQRERESDESAKDLVNMTERIAEREVSGKTDDNLGDKQGGASVLFNNKETDELSVAVTPTPIKTEERVEDAKTVVVKEATASNVVSFAADDLLVWPVHGEVLMEYSMDATTYYATLNQYKYNPGILIQSEEGIPVYACRDANVVGVAQSDELGNTVTLDIGNGYEVLYGQLGEVAVKEGDYVATGATIAKVAAPTKYYALEGDSIYMELRKDGQPIDPLENLE